MVPVRNFLYAVRCCSLSPDRKQGKGLRRVLRLAYDANEPVLYPLPEQNRELSYANVRGRKPVTSR